MKVFGENLKKLRKQNQITQEALAKILCVHFNTISSWEHNKQEPDLETLVMISNYFDVSIDLLLGKFD